MEKLREILHKYGWFLVFILTIPSIVALFVPGFYGASDDMHMAWLFEMDRVIKMGQFPPRFVPDLSFGFGYPLFNFVFPLPFYIAEVFHSLGLSLVDSVKAVLFLSIPMSALFMYLFMKQFTSNFLSLAGAVIYSFTPYRSTDIYVRGAFGEALSFVCLPLIALSVTRLGLGQSGTRLDTRWIGIGGLSLAALILTHNITAYMFLPFIFLLALLWTIFIRVNRTWTLLQLILMAVVGLFSSIYFWLPAILDSKLMVYDTVFNFSDHFPTLKQLVVPFWGYGASVPGPGDGMSFFVGTVNWLMLISGIFLLSFLWRKYSIQQKVLLSWAGISFFIAFVMMNYRSVIFWQHIPLLPYFQFPWRFLIITTFVTPLFVISLEKLNSDLFPGVVIILAILLNFTFFRPHDFLGRQDDYYLNRYIPVPKASAEYFQTGEEYLRLPLATNKRPDKNYPLVDITGGEIKKISNNGGLDSTLEISSAKGGLLNYNKYYFPGWLAELDGREVPLKAGQPFGQISIAVPPGGHQVNISFRETAGNRVLDWVSLLGVMTALVLLMFKEIKTKLAFKGR